MPSLRSIAPSSPTFVHASANFRMRNFSAALRRCRVAFADTSTSGNFASTPSASAFTRTPRTRRRSCSGQWLRHALLRALRAGLPADNWP